MAECRHHGVSVLAAGLPCPLQVRGDGLGWKGWPVVAAFGAGCSGAAPLTQLQPFPPLFNLASGGLTPGAAERWAAAPTVCGV